MSELVHCDGPDCDQVEPADRRLCDAPWMRLDRGNTDLEPMLHFHSRSCLAAWTLKLTGDAPAKAARCVQVGCEEPMPHVHGNGTPQAPPLLVNQEQQVGADDGGTVQLTQQEFDALRDYSASLPTGTAIGKQWKRRNDYYDESKGWRLGEYVEHADPDLVGIRWRDIEVVTARTDAPTEVTGR
jgi:hypothetical protein